MCPPGAHELTETTPAGTTRGISFTVLNTGRLLITDLIARLRIAISGDCKRGGESHLTSSFAIENYPRAAVWVWLWDIAARIFFIRSRISATRLRPSGVASTSFSRLARN